MASTDARYQPLSPEQCRMLANALDDIPETAIAVDRLRRGLCRAYAAGNPAHFSAAVVEDRFAPGEPAGFGSDPEMLWDVLQAVSGWDCVNVSADCANALGKRIETDTGRRIRYYGDRHYALSTPVLNVQNEAVRQLTLADLECLEAAPEALQGIGFESMRDLLVHGVVACAIVSGRIVSIAHTYARSDRHVDIGVSTLEEWRGRGFATAAASIVAQCVQRAGQIPVWSTGEDNGASLRIAKKLGFTEVARRTYVIPEAIIDE